MQQLNDQLLDVLPHLERYARHLAQDRDEAQDLVQDCVAHALVKADLYQPGTNLRAWMFTMMRNLFINGARRKRITRSYLDGLCRDGQRAALPRQLDAAMLSETLTALQGLPEIDRQAVILLVIEDHAHSAVARRTGVPVGTLKSRLSRARAKLRAIADGAPPPERPTRCAA